MTKKTHDAVYWQLDDILPADKFDSLLKKARLAIGECPTWLQALQPDMSTSQFRDYFAWYYQINDMLSRLGALPGLMEVTDSKSAEAARMKGLAMNLGLEFSEALRPISMWLIGKQVKGKIVLDDKNAKRLFQSIDGMEYRLGYARSMARHTLREAEESIISNKNMAGVHPLTDLRDMIETDFSYTLEYQGKTQRFDSAEDLKSGIYSPDPEYREATYRALFAPYQREREKFFTIYQAVVKDWAYEAKLRGYASPIAMRNAANQVPDKAIEALMKACEDERGIYHDFFKWKAGRLGLKKLTRFDLYAPLDESKQTYSYQQAVDMVLDTFSGFSTDFAKRAQQIITDQHIDSHPSATKRGGAFCATITPELSPYVMLNFAGRSRDVSTLAHELGHGVHALYAKDLPGPVQQANLPLAETASTFGEMILFEALLKNAASPAEREALLAEKLADNYATIARQAYFVKFEIAAHQALPSGASLAETEDLWLSHLHELLGSSVEVDDIFRNEWAYIPHIVHTPFYCYAYNFGELLSLALFARYKEEDKAFVPKIQSVLSAGGSRDPQLVLQDVGVDMTSEAFWRGGFSIVKDWLMQLKAIKG